MTPEEIRKAAEAYAGGNSQSHAFSVTTLTAANDILTAAGYAIVPVEPTDEMLIEGSKYLCFHSDSQVNEDARLCYRAMLSALRKE